MSKVLVTVAVLTILCSLFSIAQTTGSWRVGVGAEGGLPIGDFNTGYSFGVGGVASLGYVVDPTFVLGLKSGYLSFSGKDISGFTVPSVGIVPILVSGKYYFMPGDTKVYGAADVGMYAASGGGASSTKFGFAPTLGAEFKSGDKMWIDVHGNYTYISTDVTSTSYIGFGVGLVFDLQ